jgi:hypothetical protein
MTNDSKRQELLQRKQQLNRTQQPASMAEDSAYIEHLSNVDAGRPVLSGTQPDTNPKSNGVQGTDQKNVHGGSDRPDARHMDTGSRNGDGNGSNEAHRIGALSNRGILGRHDVAS